MSTIVYAVAFVNIFVTARLADTLQKRGILIIANCGFSIIGFVMLLASTNNSVRFAGTCLLTAALYPCTMLILVWMAMCFPGYCKLLLLACVIHETKQPNSTTSNTPAHTAYRTSAIALTNICSQLFGIVGNSIYVDPPFYRAGLTVSVCLAGFAAVLAAGLIWYLRRSNQQKDAVEEQGKKEMVGLTVDDVGFGHPEFRYAF
jgi:MFS family permease